MTSLRKRELALVLLASALVTGVVAEAVYWSGIQRFRQEIAEVANGNIVRETIELPTILEGSSAVYTEEDVPDLDKALQVSTGKEGVTLQCKFNNPSSTALKYEVYKLEVTADTVPSGSGVDVGDVVLTVSLDKYEDSVVLDAAGNWKFDYIVAVRAGQVESSEHVAQAVFMFKLGD